MITPTTVSMIRDIVAIFGVLAGFTYYVLTVQNTRKNQQMQLETRQAQLFMNIYNTFSSKEYQKDRERMFYIWEFDGVDDFFQKYGLDTNPDEHAVFDMFCSHFEGIGVLVQNGLIDSKLVYDLMYGSIIGFWTKFEPILLGIREASGDLKVWSTVEFLNDEMMRIKLEEETYVHGHPFNPDEFAERLYKRSE